MGVEYMVNISEICAAYHNTDDIHKEITICMHSCVHACVSTHVYMHVCMYVRMYVHMYV